VADPQPSPDGTQVVYVVGSYDEVKNQAHLTIWLASLEDGQCRQLTNGESQDIQPRWSPDGSRMAFVSTRHEGKPQLFLIEVTGGEAQCLTSVADGATSPLWSPDGKQLCHTSMPDMDRQKVAQETAWFKAHNDADTNAPRLRRQTTLLTRFDARGYIERRAQLFLLNLDDAHAEPRQLTAGDFDADQAAWSPDGALIAFVGIGLSQQEQAQLFTPFFRSKRVQTEAGLGTGLGLVITRTLVQMHGGTITVKSSPDQGPTFTVLLPLQRTTMDVSE